MARRGRRLHARDLPPRSAATRVTQTCCSGGDFLRREQRLELGFHGDLAVDVHIGHERGRACGRAPHAVSARSAPTRTAQKRAGASEVLIHACTAPPCTTQSPACSTTFSPPAIAIVSSPASITM